MYNAWRWHEFGAHSGSNNNKGKRSRYNNKEIIDRYSVSALDDLQGLLGYYESGKRAYEEELTKHAKELLSEADTFAKREGMKINVQAIVNASSVAEGIIDYASTTNMDLIVIGTKGKTGAHKFLVGGIANKIIDHAHCPVLAVR